VAQRGAFRIISLDMHSYQIFDRIVGSNFPLSGLIEISGTDADISVELCSGESDLTGFTWIHEWKTHEGEVAIACARQGEVYVLRFPGLADFIVDTSKNVIRALPVDGISAGTVSHLLIDQVIPRLVCHGGRMVMHASAVALDPDHTVAFLGDTGRGKSTLASSYVNSGCRLLTDDCLLVEKRGLALFGIPAYPSLRLWPDSQEAMFPGSRRFTEMAHYTNKRQLTGIETEQASADPIAITVLFVLGEAGKAPRDDSILIEAVSGMTAMMAMIESAFTLDVVSKEVARRNFQLVADVAQSGVPLYTLNYARRYELLPKVQAVVKKLVHR
jgi:hypothetical protein